MIIPTIFVLAALSLPVYAQLNTIGQLRPRQTDSVEDPEISSASTSAPATTSPTSSAFSSLPTSTASPTPFSLDSVCQSRIDALESSIPTAPPEILEFSESFYQTAPRTATGTEPECAWITSTPDNVDDLLIDYAAEIVEWALKPETQDMLRAASNCAPSSNVSDEACLSEIQSLQEEFGDEIVNRVLEREKKGTADRARMATWGIPLASFVGILLIL